jgi:hypothetical protein
VGVVLKLENKTLFRSETIKKGIVKNTASVMRIFQAYCYQLPCTGLYTKAVTEGEPVNIRSVCRTIFWELAKIQGLFYPGWWGTSDNFNTQV